MDSKPLSYDSLRTILQHMEANKRIRLAAHIPSIRPLDKALPLRVNYLTYGYNTITINDTVYNVGVYLDYGTQEAPKFIETYNSKGGCAYDFDKYGFEELDSLREHSVGDVIMRVLPVRAVLDDEETMKRLEEAAFKKKEIITEVKERMVLNADRMFKDQESMMDYIKYIAEHEHQEAYDYHRKLHEDKKKDWEVLNDAEKDLKKLNYFLQPFYSRRDNTPLPYTPHIRLTVTSKHLAYLIEMVKYDQKLENALRSLVFPSRRVPVEVKTLEVDEKFIIRVPEGLKLKIRQLHVQGNLPLVCDSLRHLIDESSYPLEEVHVKRSVERNENYQHEAVRTAKKLIIAECWHGQEASWLTVYRNLQNKIVHKVYDDGRMIVGDYVFLIRKWFDELREVGTIYTFGVRERKTAMDILWLVAKQFEGAVRGNRSVTIPMREPREICVSYEESAANECSKYTLTLAVAPCD